MTARRRRFRRLIRLDPPWWQKRLHLRWIRRGSAEHVPPYTEHVFLGQRQDMTQALADGAMIVCHGGGGGGGGPAVRGPGACWQCGTPYDSPGGGCDACDA